MSITEIVIPLFKPEVAKEGLATIRISVPKYLNGMPGILGHHVGHILKHNGQDVANEYRGLGGIEWDKPESFHDFYPGSEGFGEFVGTMLPFLGGKSSPRLFNPASNYSRSNLTFESGITQIFTGQLSGKKDDASSAWDTLLEALKKESPDVKGWSGWGIEEAEGVWVGILGYESVANLESLASKSSSVIQAMEALKAVGDLEEFVVKFG